MDEVLGCQTSIVAGRPPKIPMALSKRHSLHSGETITKFSKLKKHSSQPKLRKDVFGGSLTSLNLDSSRRYSSLAQLQSLKVSEKTLSASNLAAISDSNLSVKEAIPPRSYDQPNSSFSEIKSNFEDLVKCYYHQLTKGCGRENCFNKFCFSCRESVRFTPDVAGIISIELATRNKQYICISYDGLNTPLPSQLFEAKENKPRPFLHSLFSTTPFQTLFQPRSQSRNSEKQSNLIMHSVEGRKKCGNQCESSEMNNTGLGSTKNLQTLTGNQCDYKLLPSEKGSTQELNRVAPPGMVEAKSNILNLEAEFSKLNVSGSLMQDHSLSGMPLELFSSNSSLNEAIDLEEFEKECALEMSMGHVQEFSLTHLTLSMLESSVAKYYECKDPAFLINTIRTVFTSSQALNDSFRSVGSNGQSYLDTASVREAYKLILGLEPKDTFMLPLLNALEIHLTTLDSMIINPDEIAQLVILLENPLVQESQALLKKLCHGLSKLLPDSRHALINIFLGYDTDSFRHLLQVMQAYLGSLVSPGQCSSPYLLEVSATLGIFCDTCVQAKKKMRQELVPVAEFYNEDLSLKLDFKKEYENWRALHSAESSSMDQKLSLLDYPFLLDPASKVRVLHIDAVWQMRVEYQNAIIHQARVQQAQRLWEEVEKDNSVEDAVKSAMCPFLVLEIHRDNLIHDTLNQIALKEFDLKKPLKIKYVGGGEQGLDMGGLQKEFFHMIVEAVFDPGYGMFTCIKESHSVWINSSSLESEKEFELVGILLGLAIYNGIILDVHFPLVIYKKLQGEKLELEDLIGIQPSLAKSLRELLEFDGDVEDTFCYTFQVSSSEFGNVQSVELIPNGRNIPVTNHNRRHFVSLYVDHLLVKSVERQFTAFSQGFHKVCGGKVLTLFRPDELELLICGCPVIDFHELELAATYEEGYNHSHPTVAMLWKVVNEMSLEQKKAFLMFVTGSDRVPLKGLANLTFIVQRHGADSDRLPSALTCFNRLLLPPYSTCQKLKERLIVAIENCKGFGLT